MPSQRKGETLEAFRQRSRLYMEARAIAAGRTPVRRRKGSTLPPSPPERRGRLTAEMWQRRADYLKSVGGFWPERSFRPVFESPGRGRSGAERVRW